MTFKSIILGIEQKDYIIFIVIIFITKRMTRSENIVWNKNPNRCKTGETDI